MAITVFLSTVSKEFRPYRDRLRGDLTRHNVEVKIQEDFVDLGGETLDKLDTYIARCDAVVHLIGEMTGAPAPTHAVAALLRKYPDLTAKLPPLAEALADGTPISYTQWEAWLALYHGKPLLIAKATPLAPRHTDFAPTDESRAGQTAHLARLEKLERFPGYEFENVSELASHIAYTGILDLLAKERAGLLGPAVDHVAALTGVKSEIADFKAYIAGVVSRDTGTPLPVLNEILDAYGETAQTDQAQAVARLRVKANEYIELLARLSRLSNSDEPQVAALRQTAAMRLQTADFDGADAALLEAERLDLDAVEELEAVALRRRTSAAETRAERAAAARLRLDFRAESKHLSAAAEMIGNDQEAQWFYLARAADALCDQGQQFGDTPALHEAIVLYEHALQFAPRELYPRNWGATQNNLGNVLHAIGERESGSERLNQALAAYCSAIEEMTQDRFPLAWAKTKNNIGNTLSILGDRENDATLIHEAVKSYRDALEIYTKKEFASDWATVKNNLGNALASLGRRFFVGGALDLAVATYREALTERPRQLVPSDWATTQNNLGTALHVLGIRENSSERLEQAIVAFLGSLEERPRDRFPLAWAMIKNNLGASLQALGRIKRDTNQLKLSISAYQDALLVYKRANAPNDWATTHYNLGAAFRTLGEIEGDPAWLQQAVNSYQTALSEWTRDSAPIDWAMTMGNLAVALTHLGNSLNVTAHLAAAVTASEDAASVFRGLRADHHVATAEHVIRTARDALAKLSDYPKT